MVAIGCKNGEQKTTYINVNLLDLYVSCYRCGLSFSSQYHTTRNHSTCILASSNSSSFDFFRPSNTGGTSKVGRKKEASVQPESSSNNPVHPSTSNSNTPSLSSPTSFSKEAGPVMPAKKKGKGKKKSGKKKPKLTKEEKAQLKLDKACALITDQQDVYQVFLDRMDRWLGSNNLRARELYQRFDKNGDGVLSFQEFKDGMLDLDAPCNATELEVLARRLDRDKNGTIDYREFSKGLAFSTVENEEGAMEEPKLVTRLALCHPECRMGHWRDHIERHPKYVRVFLRLQTFDHLKSYPGHFTCVVQSHTTISALCTLIKEELSLSTTTLLIYNDKTKGSLALDPAMSLEDFGIKGRTREDPDEVTLYYNYTTEFHDCSLLSSDYYFIK